MYYKAVTVIGECKRYRMDLSNRLQHCETQSICEADIYSREKYQSILVVPDDKDMISNLQNGGLMEFEDYVIDKYVNRKIIMLYGNCHMMILANYLQKNIEKSEYVVYPIPLIHQVKNYEELDNICFKYCDVFLHQCIRKENRYGVAFASESILQRLSHDCIVIGIPNVYHLPLCYFPQFSEAKEWVLKDGQTVFFRDKILDTYYRQKKSISYMIEHYLSWQDTQFCIETSYNLFLEKVKRREKEWDIKISDFLLNNKRQYLFFDPNHPTGVLLEYIGRKILERLCVVPELELSADVRLDSYEMPLLDCVYEYFQIQRIEQLRGSASGRKVLHVKMDLAMYVVQYVSLEWQDSSLPSALRLKSKALFTLLRFCDFIICFTKRAKNKIIRTISKEFMMK